MKKNKEGFTLAETLITLTIIGVIAALTIPTLYKNVNTSTIGVSVGKTVSDIQNGMTNVLTQANETNADGLTTTSISALKVKDVLGDSAEDAGEYLTKDNLLFSKLQGYINAFPTDTSYTGNIKLYSGDDSAGLGDFSKYQFPKWKSVIMVEPIDNDSIPDDIQNDAVIAKIYVDGNGEEKPNRMGKDVFIFGLTDGGKLVPAGTNDYNKGVRVQELDEDGTPKKDDAGNDVYKYVVSPLPLYNDANGGDRCDSVINTGRTCAARLVADDWKIKY